MTGSITTRSLHDVCISTPVQPRFRSNGGPLRKLARILAVWYDRETSRRQLLRMSEHSLRDIGITQAQAKVEAERPFWQA
ncbi:MAG: DUF1127 domain-containing protein [Alphaproteobacteria bacterium]